MITFYILARRDNDYPVSIYPPDKKELVYELAQKNSSAKHPFYVIPVTPVDQNFIPKFIVDPSSGS